MTRLRVVTITGDPAREADLAPRLARGGIEVLLRCMDRVELLGALRGAGIDAIVCVGAPHWFDAQAAEEAARAGVRIVGVVADAIDADRLAAHGATLLPSDATVEEIADRCSSGEVVVPDPPAPVESVRPGRVAAVWGPKGAPGRTSVAIELAALLAAEEPATLLIDGDTYGGDILQSLGVVEEMPTILWAARSAARRELDASRLVLEVRRVPDGPVVLPGIPRPQLWADVSEFGWRGLLHVARDGFRSVVCDVGFSLERDAAGWAGAPGRNRVTLETLRTADHVVAVCRADPVGLKTFLWAFEDLREVVEDDRIVLVANRVGNGDAPEVAELLKRHTGKRPVAYVPDRPAEFRKAGALGRSIHHSSPGSDVVASMRSVALAVGGRARPRGFLARLGGRE